MKILVISDTHGSYEELLDSILYEEFDMLIHLGDYVEDGEKICEHLSLPSHIVAGNGDYGTKYKEDEIIEIQDKRIFLTHGHLYRVRNGIDSLYYKAMEEKVDLVLFGHTHIALNHIEDGIVFMNPESPSYPRKGIYDISNKEELTYGIVGIEDDIKVEIRAI